MTTPAAKLALACLACYAVVLAWMPNQGYVTVDLGGHYLQAVQLARTGRADLPVGPLLEPVLREYFPWRIDTVPPGPIRDWSVLAASWVTHRDGRFTVIYSITFAWLQALAYRLGGDAGLVVLPAVAGAVVVWATFMLGACLGLRRAWLPALVVGAGSPLALYSVLPWSHTPAVAASLSALLVLVRLCARDGPVALPAAGAGLLLGLASSFRNEGLLLAIVVLVVLPCAGGRPGRRAWLPLVLGVALALVPTALYNLASFGSVLNPVQSSRSQAYRPEGLASNAVSGFVTHRLSVLVSTLRESLFESENLARPIRLVVAALMGLGMALLAWALWSPARAPLATRAAGVILVGLPGLYLWFALKLSPQLVPGLFLCAPLLLVAVPAVGSPAAWTGGAPVRLVAATTALFVAAASMRGSPGWQWGARYLLVVQPCMAVLAVLALEKLEELPSLGGTVRAQVVLLAFVGFGMTWVGLRDLRSEQAFRQDVEQRVIRASNAPAVAFDHWFFPWENAPLALERELFYFTTPGELAALVDHLGRRGVRRLAVVTRRRKDELLPMRTPAGLRGARLTGRADVELPYGQEWHALVLEW